MIKVHVDMKRNTPIIIILMVNNKDRLHGFFIIVLITVTGLISRMQRTCPKINLALS